MLTMTENDLIEACLADDRAAQRDLYERYKRAMYSLCYRITGDHAVAADVLQDAFIKVFKHLSRFRRESTLGAWIKTIVVRTAYSQLRKAKRMPTEDIDGVDPNAYIDWGAGHLDAEYLERAILALPEGYRAVFVLIEVEGYGHKDVARLLGISEGTSKSQLYHAKKRLRAALRNAGLTDR